MEIKKQKKLHINQILKLPVTKFGKEGDAICMYNNFIIFLKTKNKLSVNINEFVEIRITKILPKFALGVLVSENINKANHTQTLNNMTIDTGGKEQSPCSTDKSGNGTDNVHNTNNKGDLE